MARPKLEITKRAAGQIHTGSLWIFSNEFISKTREIEPGTWVNFECEKQYVASGYVNPHSLIAGRVCALGPIDDITALLKLKIQSSLKRREKFFGEGSFRAVFSEADDLPGLVVDVYGEIKSPTVVAQINTAGMEKAKTEIIDALKSVFNPEALILRCDSSIRNLENLKIYSEVIQGEEAQLKKGSLREGQVRFAADFVDGQKTGFFLDQRDNRRHLGQRCSRLKVLDLCCYSGGWGLTALKGGASQVTFVDQSSEALALVERGMALNEFSMDRARLVSSDVFDFLEKTEEQFDVIIADPPAFVKSKKMLPPALKAYGKLNRLAIGKIKDEGLLYTCSCSFHLGEQDFEQILTENLIKTGRVGTVVLRGKQAEDHPWVLNRPETRYLKCLALSLKKIN